MPAAHGHGPQPGDIVGGRYRLELLIGTGGMGAVWSASVVDAPGAGGEEDEKVAIKFLHAQMAADPLVVQRFLLEARAGTEIRHPNVVRMIASGWLESEDGGESVPWLAMELLSGKNLSEVLRKRLRLEAVDAIALIADVAAGAAAAHAAKIVHRDLKPANVFLQHDDKSAGDDVVVVAKVLDFGISKFVDPNLDGGLTTTGAVVGSAMYMSPEQAMGGYQVDVRTDVWSLGVLLYRVLTGESPLPPTHQDIMLALAAPSELNLGALRNTRIPPAAASVVRRCLRKKREERFESASELEVELRRALDEEVKAKGSRRPNLRALLDAPTSSATVIAAPLVCRHLRDELAQDGDEGETTASATAPTGKLAPVSPASVSEAAPASVPASQTAAAPVVTRAGTGAARTKKIIGAAALAAVIVVVAVWKIASSTTIEASTTTTSSPSAYAASALSAPSAEPTSASNAPSEVDRNPPAAHGGGGNHPRWTKHRGPAPHAAPKSAATPPTAAATQSAPEPWRRPGF